MLRDRALMTSAVTLGIGDDMAAIATDDATLIGCDVLVDGVHGRVDVDGAASLAYKAIGVNLSDAAAMGAEPVACVVGVVLPTMDTSAVAHDVMEGLHRAEQQWGVPIVGGDTNVADAPLTIAVTVMARPFGETWWTRHGARPGDLLSVTGALGGSLAARHLRPVPRVDVARVLSTWVGVHAAMDLSDGLGKDLPRLLRASDVGARIDASRVPVHDDVQATASDDRILAALGDGEDFELLLAHAPLDASTAARLARHDIALTAIGTVVEGDGATLIVDGVERPWPHVGWDHVVNADSEA